MSLSINKDRTFLFIVRLDFSLLCLQHVLKCYLNICRFLQKYPENPETEESLEISLDEVAKELGKYL